MDSLTQIVLGAACGEAVAGKKLGNRAMLWGALGGTIPDFDIFASFFTDEISATSFHRGFMHSFLFAALAPWVLAWLAQRFYSRKIHIGKGFRIGFALFWTVFYLLAAVGINIIPFALHAGFQWWIFVPTLLLGIWLVRKLWLDYRLRDLSDGQAPYFTWVSLFFWSIFTHPILDCFTNWGTQVFQPFSDLRVQWNTVSVVDPLYTVPFGILLLIATWYSRTSRTRKALVWTGIIWGCSYLAYTWWHKQTVEQAFTASMEQQQFHYLKFQTNPSIFNNIVWTAVAEGDSSYYYGLYGFNDRERNIHPVSILPKNHELLQGIPEDARAIRFLKWFTNGYYNVLPYRGDTLQVNDLRFGLMGDSLTGNNYVFPFLLFKNEKGEWDVKQDNRNSRNMEENKAAMGKMFGRVLHGG